MPVPLSLPALKRLAAPLVALLVGACAIPPTDPWPEPAVVAEFAGWSCGRIDDELDAVQQRAAVVAYAGDERAGSSILALGGGIKVFWPALLATRPDGLEAADLARLKARYDALLGAANSRSCPAHGAKLAAAPESGLAMAVGDRLVYEDRAAARLPASIWALRVTALHRGDLDFEIESRRGSAWRQDRAGNVLDAPEGVLRWQRLLRSELALGQVVSGEMTVGGDPLAYARLRGQVVAVGPQTLADRRFDVAVIELFGDAQRGEAYTRVDGAVAVDRHSGVLLRLDLRSAQAAFALQRRLMRIESAPR